MVKPVVLLVCSFVAGLAFNIIPNTEPTNYFIFGGVDLSLKTHAYFAFDHISRMLIFWALMWLPIRGIQIFFWLEFGDFIDIQHMKKLAVIEKTLDGLVTQVNLFISTEVETLKELVKRK